MEFVGAWIVVGIVCMIVFVIIILQISAGCVAVESDHIYDQTIDEIDRIKRLRRSAGCECICEYTTLVDVVYPNINFSYFSE